MRDVSADMFEVEEQLGAVGDQERARHLKELREATADPALRVVVFGEFNRGKSTLINALLGRLVLPAKLIPTTGHITRVVFGTTEEVRVRHAGGRLETCGLDRLDSFAALDRAGQAREDVEVIEVAVNAPLLRPGLVLVDTPGVKERDAQTRRARQAIATADLVLLVLDARQLLSSGERELAVDWLGRGLGKPVALVLNFLNLVEEREHGEVRARLGHWCRQHLTSELGRAWFEVNARGALAHFLGLGPAPADDFTALLDALAACTGERRRRLQNRGRTGQLLAELREARAANAEVLGRLRTDAARVEEERAALRRDLEEQRRRFGADARARRDRLSTFALKALGDKLEALVTVWFAGEGKARLEEKAAGWYADKLAEAVALIEREADGALLELAGERLSRPGPLTVKERMMLEARLDVGTLPAVGASSTAIGVGAAIGAFVGTFVIPIPGIGTPAGALLGGFLANRLGSKEPDYVAAYAAKARERWALDARKVRITLRGQYDARVEELKRRIDERLGQASPPPLPAELDQREALARALERCERELQPA
jgi:hypothetical protein